MLEVITQRLRSSQALSIPETQYLILPNFANIRQKLKEQIDALSQSILIKAFRKKY
ncbi:MAG: hypothetical protein ABIF11_04475 [Nitrospirota bacterium]